MIVKPPKWPLLFLRWYCREDYLEEIEGNLTELFYRQQNKPAKARALFLYNVLKHFRPAFIKPVNVKSPYNYKAMLRNYFKTSFRNLVRNISYAFINVAGLATGIAVCMMIFIIIQFQTSYDTFHANKARTYRVLTQYHHTDAATTNYAQTVPYAMPVALKTSFPQVKDAAPVYASHNDELLVPGDDGSIVKKFKEARGLFYTTPSFFNIFSYPLLAGSYAALKEPNTVLLTKETAEKYFGNWQVAMGKTLKLQSGGFMFDHSTDVLKVSGILATIPANTDFQMKLVVSINTSYIGYMMANNASWDETTPDFGCYLMLPQNTNEAGINQQLSAFAKKVQSPTNKDSYIIQPLADVHYDTETGNYSNKAISHQLLNVLWLIAAFILAIACVNFVNLSTAQAVNRSKEVGVRKVLGSNKFQLQLQFIVETFLIVTIAVILAAGITLLALPYINQLLDLSISISILSSPTIIVFLLAVTGAVTVLAGFYPSIVLSRFSPITALKSKLAAGTVKGISLRRGLVVFQFIIAQALIIGTLVIVKQMDYFINQPLGFDKNAVVNVPFRIDSVRLSKMEYMKQQLLLINGVQAVSFNSNTPVEDANDMWSTFKYNHAAKEEDFKAITKFADNEYVPAYKLALVAGRNLQPSKMTKEFLINESLMKGLGITNPDEVLNKQISIWSDNIKCPVVGVLKDFNDRSLHNKPAPLLITTNNTMYNQATIKLGTTNIAATMQSIKTLWEQTFPDFVYEYRFLDDKIDSFYKQENQLAQLYKIFAGIAIFLSCLGLYGLASFMAVQRVKEVGIRKVLGATTTNIVYLFTREFILLITIAFIIAAPIAWYYMHQWLQYYVYRINIGWWVFAAGGLAAIVIALATISFQAVKAARANPVKSLRSE
jgi:putative ABC transport system permease protein